MKTTTEEFLTSLTSYQLWSEIGILLLKILGIIIVSIIVIRIGKTAIRNMFKIKKKGVLELSEKREVTLVKLLENILTYTVYFISILMILELFDIPIKSLIAGAGIIGLAVGFGAQNLVKDIITGFFIILENQFAVGDYIRTSKFEGFVEEIGFRTTKIKSWTGELHIIPNGSIVEVTNFSIHNSIAVVDVGVAYEEDIHEAENVINDLLKELPDKYESMQKPPELLGVQNLGASDVVFRVIAEVKPMEHWKTARALRKEIKNRLDERNIEIPFPRIVMYNRKEEQEGNALEG
ncbi:mechanosensitive ion channel protein MscS [Lottiidibacillus patelloidae]|uniref:Mechanosensitive ion channel protein MscS n=1 Tax=Lottiidibacillus patelloidae TaxID=2670334 RepID=A0A263BSV6_9BACI|nr:mechanosensitive ion channel protein MscS [Lottiidibacillus patelloidae]